MKNLPKIRKNREKIKRGKFGKKRQKLGRFFHFALLTDRADYAIYQVFSLGGLGVPQAAKILSIPLTDHHPAWLEPVPLNWICPPPKFQKCYHILLSILTTFWLKTASESSILCLKHKICSNFAVGGIFDLTGQFFHVPLHIWLHPRHEFPPPSNFCPQQGPKIVPESKSPPPPPKILWKNLATGIGLRSDTTIYATL